MKKNSWLWLWAVVVLVACGSEEAEDFPDLLASDLDVDGVAWVVDGMTCQGTEVVRMVELIEGHGENSGRQVAYVRGDDCVEPGEPMWLEVPTSEGEEVAISEGSDASTRSVHHLGERRFVMEGDQVDPVEMIPVTDETSPSLIPELSGIDLAGRWWMEGYPCMEEQVPQVVRVLHPPGSLHFAKVVGDQCIGDGQNFFDGDLSGTSISGEASLETEEGFFDDPGEVYEATGRVRTHNYFRLDVGGQAVIFRRVLDPVES